MDKELGGELHADKVDMEVSVGRELGRKESGSGNHVEEFICDKSSGARGEYDMIKKPGHDDESGYAENNHYTCNLEKDASQHIEMRPK